jgi:hypothetical protein
MLTDVQVRVLRRKLMEGKTQEAAAAAADMSVRSARNWQTGSYPSNAHKPHNWRTRPDPFAEVFESEIVPLLAMDERRLLEARTLLSELERRHPGCFSRRHLRTLQRRLREWRALHGPEQEVYFPQEHPPGHEAAFDFTNCNDLGVTIRGEPFPHLLFELTLSYSSWRWQMVAASESFEATAAGVQGALWELGGVSEVLRSDNLSAATHDLRRSRGRALNRRYRDLLDHYGLRATLIQVGEAHENGVVEQAHRRTKSILGQALLLRGSCDFSNIEEYQQWLCAVVEREHNSQVGERLAEERRYLRPLPAAPIPAYTTLAARVRRWSTITVLGHIYSLPSRLIGERVTVRVYPERLEVYTAINWSNACHVCITKAKCISTIATSSARWCASQALLPVIAGVKSYFPAWSSAAPMMLCAAAWASGPAPNMCRFSIWRRSTAPPRWNRCLGLCSIAASGSMPSSCKT